jgi:hypothetical protein
MRCWSRSLTNDRELSNIGCQSAVREQRYGQPQDQHPWSLPWIWTTSPQTSGQYSYQFKHLSSKDSLSALHTSKNKWFSNVVEPRRKRKHRAFLSLPPILLAFSFPPLSKIVTVLFTANPRSSRTCCASSGHFPTACIFEERCFADKLFLPIERGGRHACWVSKHLPLPKAESVFQLRERHPPLAAITKSSLSMY